jgi:hypothetical protein
LKRWCVSTRSSGYGCTNAGRLNPERKSGRGSPRRVKEK